MTKAVLSNYEVSVQVVIMLISAAGLTQSLLKESERLQCTATSFSSNKSTSKNWLMVKHSRGV